MISSPFRRDGAFKHLTPDLFIGSPLEDDYKKLSPSPNDFAKFVRHLVAAMGKERDLTAAQMKATQAPMFLIFGDAYGVRLEHIRQRFPLKGGGTHGDIAFPISVA